MIMKPYITNQKQRRMLNRSDITEKPPLKNTVTQKLTSQVRKPNDDQLCNQYLKGLLNFNIYTINEFKHQQCEFMNLAYIHTSNSKPQEIQVAGDFCQFGIGYLPAIPSSFLLSTNLYQQCTNFYQFSFNNSLIAQFYMNQLYTQTHLFTINFTAADFLRQIEIQSLGFINILLTSMANRSSVKVLPTIKKLCYDQDQVNFQNYKENGLILKHTVTTLKIKNLVRTFVSKLKRNVTKSQPIDFKPVTDSQIENERIIKWKGWDIEDHFEGFILIMDTLMSIVMFYIATFQGFLDDFIKDDTASAAVITVKAFAIFFFVSRLIMDLVTIQYEDDRFYLYITDIVLKQVTKWRYPFYLFELIMTIVSLAMPYSSTVGIILCFAVFAKIMLTTKNIKQLEQIYFNSVRSYYIWNLIKLLIFNIFFGHTIATIFLGAAKINPEQNWVLIKLVTSKLVPQPLNWYKIYIWAYYWATTLATTIGFGDISPVDYREAVIVALIEVFGTMILAYNISEVGSIITSIRKPIVILDRKLAVVRRMNKQNYISDELSGKLESYLAHQVEIKESFQYQEHRQIMMSLPEQLRQQYYDQANKITYSQLPFFKDLQGGTKLALTVAFEGKVYYPKEYIVKCRQPVHQIVIIRKGSFSLCFWKERAKLNGTPIQTISNQQSGIPYLVTTNILSRFKPLTYDIIANKYTYALVLPVQKFIEILKNSKIDYFYYLSVIDTHQKNPNPYDYIMCPFCHGWHSKFDCTKLHFIPFDSEVTFLESKRPGKHVGRSFIKRYSKGFSSYRLRKNFFKQVERQAYSSRQLDQDQVDHHLIVDVAYNFAQYFQFWNCENLKGTPLGRRQRKLTLFGKTILHSLKKIHSVKQLELKLDAKFSREYEHH